MYLYISILAPGLSKSFNYVSLYIYYKLYYFFFIVTENETFFKICYENHKKILWKEIIKFLVLTTMT